MLSMLWYYCNIHLSRANYRIWNSQGYVGSLYLVVRGDIPGYRMGRFCVADTVVVCSYIPGYLSAGTVVVCGYISG